MTIHCNIPDRKVLRPAPRKARDPKAVRPPMFDAVAYAAALEVLG